MTFENEADRVDENEADQVDTSKLGRRTIDDPQLTANLTVLVNMLSSWWPHVGWQLITASSREQIRAALLPLKDHPDRHLIGRLSRSGEVIAEASEIRKKRVTYRQAVERRYSTQSERDRCGRDCRELEAAINAARTDQINGMLREFVRQGSAYHSIYRDALIAEAEEEEGETELLAMESGFAQEQLLLFITKAKYTLNPWHLARAMAGLPYAIEVPFLGAPQSHYRCAALICPAWPNYRYQIFETIRSCWEHAQHSTLSPVDVFQNKIHNLPRVVMQTHPTMGKHKCDNYVRSHLCENWWDMERAIELSLKTTDDLRPMHFTIAANFDLCIGQPKTMADVALAKAARLRD
jgi:hypothetical protein